MSEKNSRSKRLGWKILNSILTIILLFGVYLAYQNYQKNNFNDFVRSEVEFISKFERDNEVKYGDERSYKIESEEFNDAMFYKKVKVKKNTPYKVTCMVKTNEVEVEQELNGDNKNSLLGAHISIEGSTEKSESVQGTQDWQKIEMIFNSKNREEVNLGFRLGGNAGSAKGEAWFSDFTLEEGIAENNSEWKFGCFVFETTDVQINGKQVKVSMTNTDYKDVKNTVERFENACFKLTKGKMTAKCDMYKVETPITSLSYDKEFGYYVSPEDVEMQIKETVKANNYDHIFIILRLGDEDHIEDIEVNDWIGLGAMDYYGIGFSNIRLPNDSKNFIYKYDTRINTFPEEVLLHEFLHTLERNAKENGYEIPGLHDFPKYGYEKELKIGQKKWYTDYMNKEIKSEDKLIGLPEEIYHMKPAKSSNFEYTYKIDEFKEPENFVEEINQIIKNLAKNIKHFSENKTNQ